MHPNLSSILTGDGPKLIGMVHVGALPGTPFAEQSVQALVDQAVLEARIIEESGFDSIIVENMHDTPYVHGDELGPEIVAGMTRVCDAVVDAVGIPVGVQILSGGNRHALAVAHTVGCRYIRCENFVFAHVADEGLLDRAEAGALLRYRRSIGAEGVQIFCDIKKKHASHALTGDLGIAHFAHGGEFFGADGFIVTGQSTGQATELADVKAVREVTDLPVLVGSGVTPDCASDLCEYADALIVGSWIKADGFWKKAVDPQRAVEMVKAVRG
ncbi:MAG: BtpA/SgcQ family protein [Phycisphaerales bacterium]|nr:BtpA/SgcQ family protein [Phycisphaerales bacterium]